MWRVKVNGETMFQNECQRKCFSHLIIKNYYEEEGYRITTETDRLKLEIRITKTKIGE